MAAYTEMNEDDILAAYKVKYEADILLTKCQLHTLLSNLQPELVLTLGSGRALTTPFTLKMKLSYSLFRPKLIFQQN